MRGNHPIDCVADYVTHYVGVDESEICPVDKEKGKADRTDFHKHWERRVVGKEKREC